MIQNIPFELQQLNQWVVASGAPLPNGDVDKVPRNPRTGAKADVNDPSTWGTFAEAQASSYKLLGFVLSPDDPYTIIDLDDPREKKKGVPEENLELVRERTKRHAKILEMFETYAEYSTSGMGIHIIARGKIPKGHTKDRVEVYSQGRYMVCTGNPYNTFPITDQQALLDILYAEMSSEREEVDLVQVDGNLSDDEICRMAYNAANGQKFWQLWQGIWKDNPLYTSQSEADFALLAIIAFYTKDNSQVRRIFRASALGKRDKAQRDDRYINYALRKIRAHELPPVEMTELLSRAASIQKQNEQTRTDQGTNAATGQADQPEQQDRNTPGAPAGEQAVESGADQPARPKDKKAIEYPPGFVGELAEYFYQTSVMPVREIALVAALGLMSGVVGRSYNISNTGLNQYLVLVADTGVGKEGISNCIESMIAQVRSQVPGADVFIGPANFASGQALVKTLPKQHCFVSILGEFGLRLQEICSPKANTATQMFHRLMLDLYNKSGFYNMLRPTVHSDSEKNTVTVQAPNMTIVGETTPGTFYDKLDFSHLQSGLIPRLTIIEYKGQAPELNEGAGFPAPPALLERFTELVVIGLSTAQNRTFYAVPYEPDAKQTLDKFRSYCRKQQNEGQEVEKQLWSRAHLKALRLAALVAVGVKAQGSVVTKACADWACAFIHKETSVTVQRFKKNEFGSGVGRQDSDIRRVIEEYLSFPCKKRISYGASAQVAEKPLIPANYIRTRALNLASFTNDRRGPDAALEQILKAMESAGVLVKLTQLELMQQGVRTRMNVFGLGESWS
jgi:hypothetical protein